jgi:hypothetical protein
MRKRKSGRKLLAGRRNPALVYLLLENGISPPSLIKV